MGMFGEDALFQLNINLNYQDGMEQDSMGYEFQNLYPGVGQPLQYIGDDSNVPFLPQGAHQERGALPLPEYATLRAPSYQQGNQYPDFESIIVSTEHGLIQEPIISQEQQLQEATNFPPHYDIVERAIENAITEEVFNNYEANVNVTLPIVPTLNIPFNENNQVEPDPHHLVGIPQETNNTQQNFSEPAHQIPESSEDPESKCVVCGEPSNSYHYCQITCNSCKLFFRR